jgi:hypothetical protein
MSGSGGSAYTFALNQLILYIMKTTKIIFWITTSIIFLMEGVMPALFSQSEAGKEGIRHLGYPVYFGIALAVFKVLGAVSLMIPKVPARIREWAYAGLAFVFVFASISHFAVDGFGMQGIMPLIFLAILVVSYRASHKLQHAQDTGKAVIA